MRIRFLVVAFFSVKSFPLHLSLVFFLARARAQIVPVDDTLTTKTRGGFSCPSTSSRDPHGGHSSQSKPKTKTDSGRGRQLDGSGMYLDKVLSHVEFLRILSNPKRRPWAWTTSRSCQGHIASGCGSGRHFFVLILKHVEYEGITKSSYTWNLCVSVYLFINLQQNQIVAVDDTSVFGIHLDKILSCVEYLWVWVFASLSALHLSNLKLSDTKSLCALNTSSLEPLRISAK